VNRARRDALLEKRVLGLGRAQDIADLAVELHDDGARSFRRREKPEPELYFHPRDPGFHGARDFGRAREARGGGHGERLDLPAFNCPCAVRGERNDTGTSPARTAVSALPALL